MAVNGIDKTSPWGMNELIYSAPYHETGTALGHVA
jgi:hypothetical protein